MTDTITVRIAKLIVQKAAGQAFIDGKVLGKLSEAEYKKYLEAAADSLTTAETGIWISQEIGHA